MPPPVNAGWGFVIVFTAHACLSSGLGESFSALIFTLISLVASFVLYETLAARQARLEAESSATPAASPSVRLTPVPAHVDPADIDLPAADLLHKNFSLDRPVADELGKLLDLVIRDYVEFWYTPLVRSSRV